MLALRRRLPAAAVLMAAALLLPACGGSDEEDVQDAVRDFASAIEDKDYGKACDGVTEQVRLTFGNAATGGAGCEKVFQQANEAGGLEGLPTSADDLEFDKTEVRGDSATVKIKGDDTGDTTLRKEDGEWKLDVL
ncbi:MAG TPA: hypothetical protein VFD31_01605 [Thermoleophilaceae bacterium]|nr:hypothetical protein [Thermoleophilaceae bacterium]